MQEKRYEGVGDTYELEVGLLPADETHGGQMSRW